MSRHARAVLVTVAVITAILGSACSWGYHDPLAPRESVTVVWLYEPTRVERVEAERLIQSSSRYLERETGVTAPIAVVLGNDVEVMMDDYETRLELEEDALSADLMRILWDNGAVGVAVSTTLYVYISEHPVAIDPDFTLGTSTSVSSDTYLSYAIPHEISHIYQNVLVGGLSRPSGVPLWLVEGGAEFWRWNILDGFGSDEYADYRRVGIERSRGYSETLAMVAERPTGSVQLLGALAMDLLNSTSRPGAVVEFWRRVGAGEQWEDAFERAFALSPDEFIAKFDSVHRPAHFPPNERRISGSLRLPNATAQTPLYIVSVMVCPEDSQELRKLGCVFAATSGGEFSVALRPGVYRVKAVSYGDVESEPVEVDVRTEDATGAVLIAR
jgi:hypothetical protein